MIDIIRIILATVFIVWLACAAFALTLIVLYLIGNMADRAFDWIDKNI